MAILGASLLMLGILAPAVGATEDSTPGADALEAHVEESAYGSYIVVMRQDPLLAAFDRAGLITAAAAAERTQMRNSHDRVLREAGLPTGSKVNEYTNAANGFSAFMSHQDAILVAGSDEVLAVMPDHLHQPTTDNTPSFLELTGRGAAWASGYTGENVIVGIIDSGIWPEHPSFADDGSYRDLGIALDESMYPACDFGNQVHNPNDAEFACNDKLVGARQILSTYRTLIGAESYEYDSARDEDGHGTHTASTAAGNAEVAAEIFGLPRGVVSGVAPRARVIAYKGLGSLGGFTSDLAAAIDQAVLDGVDVINYSIGGGPGPVGLDDLAFLFAADAGVFVATSSGNGGPGPSSIGAPAWLPWLTSVGASNHDRTFEGSASSSDGWEFFGASITAGTGELRLIDAAEAGDELCNIGALDPTVTEGAIVLCLRGSIARVDKSRAVYAAGGAGMILYNASDAQAEITDNHWVPSVHISNTGGRAIKDYIALAGDLATAQINGGEVTEIDAPVMASFSSRGPNPVAGDIIKPDVTAPGVNVLAGASPTPEGFSLPHGGAPGQLFQSISGTSMASPHVAGLFALLKQAHPDWTPAMAKSAVMTTAHQHVLEEDGATPADPFDMGAGHVDPGRRANGRGSIFNPGIVYDTGLEDYLGFLCDVAPEVFVDPATSCAFLEDAGISTDASDLNLASIAVAELSGTQTVTRTITSVAQRTATWRAEVEAPQGYTAQVTPSEVTLAPRESASFTVTFTATDAALVDVWRFGSLIWRAEGGPAARSPIALSAVSVAEAGAAEDAAVADVTHEVQ